MVASLQSEASLGSVNIPGDHLLTSDKRLTSVGPGRQSVAQWLLVIKQALERALPIKLHVVDVEAQRQFYSDTVIDQKPFLFHTRLDILAASAAPRLLAHDPADPFPVFLATTSLRCEHICLHPPSDSPTTVSSLAALPGPMDSATDPNQWFLGAWNHSAVLIASMLPTPPVGGSVDVHAMVEAAVGASSIAAGGSILDATSLDSAAALSSYASSPQVNVNPGSSVDCDSSFGNLSLPLAGGVLQHPPSHDAQAQQLQAHTPRPIIRAGPVARPRKWWSKLFCCSSSVEFDDSQSDMRYQLTLRHQAWGC